MSAVDNPVVVGIDGTPESRAAATYAAWEATRLDRGLRLIHAHQPPPHWGPSMLIASDYAGHDTPMSDLMRAWRAEISEGHPGLDVDAAIRIGSPASVLVAESGHASLLVVGTRAHGGVGGRLSGSVAAQLAAHADVPVVAFRGDALGSVGFHGRPVVVGLDGSEESRRALAFAIGEAVAREAPLHAVFVWDVVGSSSAPDFDEDTTAMTRAEAGRFLDKEVASGVRAHPSLSVTTDTVAGIDAADGLCRAAHGAGLVVVGSRGRGGFLGLRLGSTGDALIRRSQVAVAVVRGA